MGQYIDHRPKLTARILRQQERNEAAAHDRGIMERLIAEDRQRRAMALSMAAAEKDRRRQARPPKAAPLSRQEIARQKVREVLDTILETGERRWLKEHTEPPSSTCVLYSVARGGDGHSYEFEHEVHDSKASIHMLFLARFSGMWLFSSFQLHDKLKFWTARAGLSLEERQALRCEAKRRVRAIVRRLCQDLTLEERAVFREAAAEYRQKAREIRETIRRMRRIIKWVSISGRVKTIRTLLAPRPGEIALALWMTGVDNATRRAVISAFHLQ